MSTSQGLWESTGLWRQIAENTQEERAPSRLLLNSAAPRIELVLSSGGTAQKDFTLHDAGHGYRVAVWMERIIGPELLKKLSTSELAILLLSAYLHDIGMSPEWGKVAAHRNYLQEGSTSGLTPKERDLFQLWLAEREGVNFAPPMREIEKVDELITYYCRSQHNDWSGEWIEKELLKFQVPPLYEGWLDDLILVCKSHHYGYAALRSEDYRPRDLGAEGVVHRRYLAAVLRMADILDNDPERTPDVLLYHRVIAQKSKMYWVKDHFLHENLQGDKLTLSATPPNALLHKAIEDTADAIDEELALCDRLSRELPFNIHPITGEASLPHTWLLPARSLRHIQPMPGKYEYIPGGFRPNTGKLLELLSGMQLYGEQLVGIRELLQNAFDGVREQIAREQIKSARPDKEFAQLLGKTHLVKLRFEVKEGRGKLQCTDSGAGMSKPIIRDRLLVSGQASDTELIALQLKCKEMGIPFIRTGQFGLGVLSYFMLADHVVFRTRRSADCETAENHGWEFETWGVGSFGELRPVSGMANGTEVTLDLRGQLNDVKATDWYRKLCKYVKDLLVRIPCRFELSTNLEKLEVWKCGPGWCRESEGWKEELDLESHERMRALSRAALTSLRWLGPADFALGESAVCRVMVPYFKTDNGNSLVWPDFLRGVGPPDKGTLATIKLPVRFAWKGMGISAYSPRDVSGPKPAFVEMDLEAMNARLAVNRRSVFISEPQESDLRRFINESVNTVRAPLLESNEQGHHAWLNRRYARVKGWVSNPFWTVLEGDVERWEPIRFPCVLSQDLPEVAPYRVNWRGRAVSLVTSLLTTSLLTEPLECFGLETATMVVVVESPEFRVVPLWDAPPVAQPADEGFPSCSFPEEWRRVLGLEHGAYHGITLYNRDHPLFARARGLLRRPDDISHVHEFAELRAEFLTNPIKAASYLAEYAEYLTNPIKAASYLVAAMTRGLDEYKQLLNQDANWVRTVWETGFDGIPFRDYVLVISQEGSQMVSLPQTNCYIIVYRQDGVQKLRIDELDVREYLPDPGDDWKLSMVGEAAPD